MANPFSDLPLAALVHACAESREETAWEEFFERTRRSIGLIILRSLRRWQEPAAALVEDLIQETYLKLCSDDCNALRRLEVCSDEAVFAFLKVVAARVALDYGRATHSQKRHAGKLVAMESSAEVPAAPSVTPSFDRDILLKQIDGCLKSPAHASEPKDREIFWLHYRFGFSARAIAEIPAVGTGGTKSVERRLARMMEWIRQCLARNPQFVRAKSQTPRNLVVRGEEAEIG